MIHVDVALRLLAVGRQPMSYQLMTTGSADSKDGERKQNMLKRGQVAHVVQLCNHLVGLIPTQAH
jgi:hypothetical protein